jgi:hypothetical protein
VRLNAARVPWGNGIAGDVRLLMARV